MGERAVAGRLPVGERRLRVHIAMDNQDVVVTLEGRLLDDVEARLSEAMVAAIADRCPDQVVGVSRQRGRRPWALAEGTAGATPH